MRILICTICYNVKKLRKMRTTNHFRDNSYSTKITMVAMQTISQNVCRNSAITTRTLVIKLLNKSINLSYRIVRRYLDYIEYKNSLL